MYTRMQCTRIIDSDCDCSCARRTRSVGSGQYPVRTGDATGSVAECECECECVGCEVQRCLEGAVGRHFADGGRVEAVVVVARARLDEHRLVFVLLAVLLHHTGGEHLAAHVVEHHACTAQHSAMQCNAANTSALLCSALLTIHVHTCILVCCAMLSSHRICTDMCLFLILCQRLKSVLRLFCAQLATDSSRTILDLQLYRTRTVHSRIISVIQHTHAPTPPRGEVQSSPVQSRAAFDTDKTR